MKPLAIIAILLLAAAGNASADEWQMRVSKCYYLPSGDVWGKEEIYYVFAENEDQAFRYFDPMTKKLLAEPLVGAVGVGCHRWSIDPCKQ